jgi:putative transposase
MTFDPDIHRRCSIRLADYDYSSAGFYFVTICVQGRESLLGEVVDDGMVLNHAGRMVENTWKELPQRFPNVQLDTFVVMPNHFHAILILDGQNNINNGRGEPCVRPELPPKGDHGDRDKTGDHKDRPYGTLDGSAGRIIQAFKSLTTNAYINGVKNDNWPPFPGKLWQRNYYERIIRNDNELHNIRQYIHDNPANWADDNENPANHPTAIDP